jgi:hypothetical protein
VGRRRDASKVGQDPLVFEVEWTLRFVGGDPQRPDRFPPFAKGDQQRFNDRMTVDR